MYLRHSTVRKNGKTHTYWRLVRSVRRNGKVKQETVAQLGELDEQGRAKARALALAITGGREQTELFETEPASNEPIPVKLDGVCEAMMPRGNEEIPWATMVAILVIARLCEPSSELYIAENWYRRTALEDLLERLGELFSIDYELLLYDVTSTYFEGQAERNAMAKRGHSRDKRSDCKQVCIALVVTREGIPLGYEVFDGNRTDVTTVEEIVDSIEEQYGRAERVWVMDRGMSSKKNVAWLQSTGRKYLMGASKEELKRFEAQLCEPSGWTEVRDGVEAKICPDEDGAETFVLVRSAERQKKERAMHERFAKRIEEGLESLGRRLERSRKELERGPIERQIGRLLGKNSRAAGRYDIRVFEDTSKSAGLRLEWTRRTEWDDWSSRSEGCYVLRTNTSDWTPEQLWRTYIQLTEAEAAFRIQKTQFSLRPIWHQRADRVQAHILVCFLAYVLWKTLEQWQMRAGLGNSPCTLLDELGSIQSTDVVLPLATAPEREARIRCVMRPDRSKPSSSTASACVYPPASVIDFHSRM